MPQSLALFLMILSAGAYSLQQALSVRKMFPGETLRGEVLQRLLYGGFAIAAALVLNALGFLNAEVWRFENQSVEEAVQPDGSIAEPSLFGLMLAQLDKLRVDKTHNHKWFGFRDAIKEFTTAGRSSPQVRNPCPPFGLAGGTPT